MSRGLDKANDGYRFATLIDADGNPPCNPADDCSTCRLFSSQRPGESRAEWLARITGIAPNAHKETAS